ncbi:hypothetical protein EI94DRAFT_1723204 [Lactarius quietus]|nr:hypothetical protein EI94DRAFT_1723204 [Lactarius quietus]
MLKCPVCRISYRVQNIAAHSTKCKREREELLGSIKYEKALEKRTLRALAALETRTVVHKPSCHGSTAASLADAGSETTSALTHKYLISGQTHVLDKHSSGRQLSSPPPDAELWRPIFKSREDFEFAEIVMKSGMSKDLCERLIKIIRRCLEGKGSITLSNYSDVLRCSESMGLLIPGQLREAHKSA